MNEFTDGTKILYVDNQFYIDLNGALALIGLDGDCGHNLIPEYCAEEDIQVDNVAYISFSNASRIANCVSSSTILVDYLNATEREMFLPIQRLMKWAWHLDYHLRWSERRKLAGSSTLLDKGL